MTSSDPEHTNDLTQVELLWLKQRIENWIRFGRIADETIINSNRRVVSFSPGSIFAFVRWASNDYGTVASRIDILRAITPGERYSTVPYVRPGAEILCCRPSTPSTRSASIRPTLRLSTGVMSTTGYRSTKCRAATRRAGTRRGCNRRRVTL